MANRLAEETSPYLLQHKDNPVDWYPWGEEALEKAREEDKPDPALGRLQRVPLVPRHGARVLRGRGDRAHDERALRQHQGRPRGAAGHRLDLHVRRPGPHPPRRLADDRLPHPRRRPVLRRHLLPARPLARDALLPATPPEPRRRLREPPRRGPQERRVRPRLPQVLHRRRHAEGRGRRAPSYWTGPPRPSSPSSTGASAASAARPSSPRR